MGPRPGGSRLVNPDAAVADAPAKPEWDMATDMVRRGLPVAPALLLLGALGWGIDGALSAGFGLALALANLLASAALIAWGGRRSLAMLAAAAAGGWALRMGIVVVAVWAVKDMAWVELLPLGLSILVTQLGLLFWESRHLSLTLAYPGLKPRTGRS